MNDATAPKPPELFGAAAAAIIPAGFDVDVDVELQPALPGDHPAWQRDVLAISARVRAILATLRPIAVRVITFWDHVARSVTLGNGRSIEIDPSGCYRLR